MANSEGVFQSNQANHVKDWEANDRNNIITRRLVCDDEREVVENYLLVF
jgi:hypothetical protein